MAARQRHVALFCVKIYTMKNIYDCIIIGAGVSGLFCAASMPRTMRGLILEKTSRPGTKLLMSGSGQCNVTHDGPIRDFVDCYGENGRKIRKCLYRYSNASLAEFLETGGIATVTREDGKVFPASMSSRTILDMLLKRSGENGFSIKCDHAAEHIAKAPEGWTVRSLNATFTAKALVIATGGCSYPSTGSDGSMFSVLKKDLGLSVTRLIPALSPIRITDYPYGELSGISFPDARVSVWDGDRRIVENSGGLLLTHGDLSGPAVLNISKYAAAGFTLKISYVGALRYEDVLDRLKKATHRSKAELSGVMADELDLPKRFCRILTERHGSSLKKLTSAVTGETLVIDSVAGFGRAMCTCGGVDLSQIDTTSMEVKSLPGLFVTGEALDIDGTTGGYNIQFAYSSARAAADRIAGTVS